MTNSGPSSSAAHLCSKTGDYWVEVSNRGEAVVDQMFDASTLVHEVARGCQ